MNDFQPDRPDPKVFDAAVTLGDAIRLERGRFGLWKYLSVLTELMPHGWVAEVADRLSAPCPPPHGTFDPEPEGNIPTGPPPPPPRQPMDMEKLLRIMQLMGNLKGQ